MSGLRRKGVDYNLTMHFHFKQRLAGAWLAMLSILFGALAPTVSHAMAAAQPLTEEVQVCTMAGMVTVVLSKAQSEKSPVPTQDHMFKHCAYCLVHGGAMPAPPVAAFVLPVIPQSKLYPSLFYRSAAPLFAWTVALSRAPPSIA